ncbi:MAG: phosphomannomutase / phosphoglucomutase, partial [Gammaproteobacteria bacterium]|nr:phosphomannomutase / phosphoglucomutase [Gammaproteobacteria bacterium]
KVHHEPDGNFPNGIPNPMIEENRAPTAAAIRAHGADFGIAWDGDFDRCFLFDEKGGFIEGYYIVGLLASALLRGQPGGKVVHDPRLTWNTIEIVKAAGGAAVLCKSGHAFIKQRMREVDGVYGGEMSAHHYFRRFAYCDSGMIPWLLIAQILSETPQKLSALVDQRIALFPVSGELNYRVPDSKAAIAAVEQRYAKEAEVVDRTDGVSFEFPTWRFNLRTSNTEPLIRLNVEARGSVALMHSKTEEVLSLLKSQGAVAADH